MPLVRQLRCSGGERGIVRTAAAGRGQDWGAGYFRARPRGLRAYGGNWQRLSEVKRDYDPDNVFRHNANIEPARTTI